MLTRIGRNQEPINNIYKYLWLLVETKEGWMRIIIFNIWDEDNMKSPFSSPLFWILFLFPASLWPKKWTTTYHYHLFIRTISFYLISQAQESYLKIYYAEIRQIKRNYQGLRITKGVQKIKRNKKCSISTYVLVLITSKRYARLSGTVILCLFPGFKQFRFFLQVGEIWINKRKLFSVVHCLRVTTIMR